MGRLRNIGRLRAGGSGFSPASLGSRLLIWIDRSDLSTAWQDSARTTPAVIGQPVGSRQNKGSLSLFMQQTTSGSRAVLTQDGNGQLYDAYDGLDDGSLSSVTADFSAFNKVTCVIGLRKEFDGAAAIAAELTATASGTNGGAYVGAPDRVAAVYGFAARGTVAVTSGVSGTFTSPTANTVVVTYDTSAGTAATQIVVDINGSTTYTPDGGATTAGNFANATYYEGRRNNANLPFTGRIYQTIWAANATASEIAQLKQFVISKMT